MPARPSLVQRKEGVLNIRHQADGSQVDEPALFSDQKTKTGFTIASPGAVPTSQLRTCMLRAGRYR